MTSGLWQQTVRRTIGWAAEISADLSAAAAQVIEAAKTVAAETSLAEKVAVARAAEGALQAAEAIGPEAVAQVVESLPEEILPLDIKEDRT